MLASLLEDSVPIPISTILESSLTSRTCVHRLPLSAARLARPSLTSAFDRWPSDGHHEPLDEARMFCGLLSMDCVTQLESCPRMRGSSSARSPLSNEILLRSDPC